MAWDKTKLLEYFKRKDFSFFTIFFNPSILIKGIEKCERSGSFCARHR